jgi:hypothetical protein
MRVPNKVTISDACDSFDITIDNWQGEKVFHFDQEENHEKLVDMFKYLGCVATYEEVY